MKTVGHKKQVNPLKTGTLANSEDPDEMPNDATFHQGLHCLLRQNQSSEKEYIFFESLPVTQ